MIFLVYKWSIGINIQLFIRHIINIKCQNEATNQETISFN